MHFNQGSKSFHAPDPVQPKAYGRQGLWFVQHGDLAAPGRTLGQGATATLLLAAA